MHRRSHGVRRVLRFYLLAALAVALLWCLVAVGGSYANVVSPALGTLAVLMICGSLAPNPLLGIACGGLLHAAVFLASNVFVLRRARRAQRPHALYGWLPSIVSLALTVTFSALYWAAGLRLGLHYQGLAYVVIFGALNLGALSGLARWLFVHASRDMREGTSPSETTVLAFGLSLHVAYLLVLFPWLGEMP